MTARRKAAIIALHDLHMTSRVLKQAAALSGAGYDVTAIGIVRRSSDAELEQTDFGRIVRVRTTKNLYEERPSDDRDAGSTQASHSRSALAGLRTFAGRMRDNLLMARAAEAAAPDVVIASDQLAWAAGYRVKRRLRVPLVIDVRDLVADSGTAEPPVYTALVRRLERFVALRADALTTVTPLMGEVLAERYPAAPSPVCVYNGPVRCVRSETAAVHAPLRLLFQGNLLRDRHVDRMIEATAALGGSAVLTVQGFGGIESELRKLAGDLGAGEVVRFVETCPPSEVAEAASEHDVGLVSNWADTLNMRVTVGTKLFDYISGGLAVVSSDLPTYRAIIEEARCGVVFDPREPGALESVLRDLVSNPDEILRMKRNAVEACPGYSWEVQGQRFLEVVESVMGSHRHASGGARQ